MHQMRAGVGDGGAAVPGGPKHIEARLQVVRLGDAGFQAGEQLFHADERIVVADRIGDRGGKAFNQVTQRIDAGRGGDVRRHAGGQFRRQRHVIGQHHWRNNADLGLLFRDRQNRVGRRLGTSAGGGGDQQRCQARFRLHARQQRFQRRRVRTAKH